jgi:hypothetical protein
MPPNATATLVSAIVATSHILEDSIMRGLYDSFSAELKLLFYVFAQWLPQSPYPFPVAGGQSHITREDFSPNLQIKPIVDPNASSAMQQMAIGETLLSLAQQSPDLYNNREVNKYVLKSLKIPNIDKVLLPDPNDVPPPPELDFVSENARVLRGEAIQVYATQDHTSHELGHSDMVTRLTENATPDDDNSDKITALQSHINDHQAYNYLAQIQALMGKDIPPEETISKLPTDVQNQISVLAAKAIQKQQAKDAKANPPPIDPNVVMMEELKVKQQELEVKQQQNDHENQLAQIKMQDEKQQLEVDNQIKIKELTYKEGQLELERLKLEMQHQEMMMKQEEAMAKIQLQKEEMQLNNQTKSYDSTLKYELGKQVDQSRIETEERKSDLDAQSKAYDSTLQYEQKNKEDSIENTNDEK